MSAVDDTIQGLADAVNGNGDVKQSAVMVLQGLADLVEGSATDPQTVDLSAKIRDSAELLGAAIANTSPAKAEPQPEPQPEPADPNAPEVNPEHAA